MGTGRQAFGFDLRMRGSVGLAVANVHDQKLLGPHSAISRSLVREPNDDNIFIATKVTMPNLSGAMLASVGISPTVKTTNCGN